ncbi:hypothetical protein TrRE_jg8419 [Triparma retinervis]|uniref:Uncharacterized protein n=1 Tax=Triparma retinervis TaxID=2557542 RepID=A0A9W7E3U8_9STRA|nr:hypothetical protein TrRE_jg8419 [Triparma retinervis]
MVFIPGGNVPNEDYNKTVIAVQEEVAETANMFVAVLGFSSRKCIKVCPTSKGCFLLHNQVKDAVELAREAGFDGSEEDIIIASHSLGGTCANYLVQGYPEEQMYHNGAVFYGAYVDEQGDFGLENYPAPFAMIGAELDGGLARPGKMANWLFDFNKLSADIGISEAVQKSAVLILPSIDHSDFCPGFQVPGDIFPSEVEGDVATKEISQTTAAWLKFSLFKTPSKRDINLLKKTLAFTTDLLSPYFEALNYEVMNPAMHYLGEGGSYSPLCEDAQMILLGFNEADSSRVKIGRGCDSEGFDDSRSCAYLNTTSDFEHSRSQYSLEEGIGGLLSVNVSGHAEYYSDFLNTGSFTCASEVGCKMLSGARIADELGVEYDAATSRGTCRDVNQHSIDVAIGMLEGSRTLERYEKFGKKICLGEDFDAYFSAGPAWIKEALEIEETDECLSVKSVKIDTELDSRLFPGVHYCKLLSPARVIDWIMTDSLKEAKLR